MRGVMTWLVVVAAACGPVENPKTRWPNHRKQEEARITVLEDHRAEDDTRAEALLVRIQQLEAQVKELRAQVARLAGSAAPP